MKKCVPKYVASVFLSSLTAAILSGCPGELQNIERFTTDSGPQACSLDVERDLFASSKCSSSGCHTGSTPQAELDLKSEGVASRLLGVASTTCDGHVLVDPANPDPAGSFLYEKITSEAPSCGARMPLLGRLNTQEINCIRAWIIEKVTPDAGTTDSGATDAAVDGGAS